MLLLVATAAVALVLLLAPVHTAAQVDCGSAPYNSTPAFYD